MKKKIVTILFLLLIACTCVFAADGDLVTSDKSQVEQVMLKKGTLITKEFYPCSKINSVSSTTGDIIVVTDVTSGAVTSGLRLSHSYYNSKYDNGDSTAVLDAKELDSVIATLEFLNKKLPTYNKSTPYTEIIYKSNGGMEIGAYHSDGSQKFFIKFDYKDTAFFDIARVADFLTFFNDAKNKMISLKVFN